MKNLNLSRATVKRMATDIESALGAIEQKYGVKIEYKSASFTGDNATFKIQASVINANGAVVTPEVTDFNRYAKAYGWNFKIGDKFKAAGTTYTIAGYSTRSRKYKFLASANGKTYKVTEDFITKNI